MSDKPLSDIGDEIMSHYEYNSECSLNVPGDPAQQELSNVDCPECLAKVETIRQRRARARG